MATQIEVFVEGKKLRERLFELSQDGTYSAPEREGFARLLIFYHMHLERFLVAPCCGQNSAQYDMPLMSAQIATQLSHACKPGNAASQQPFYDAVHAAAGDLKQVTNDIARPFKKVPV